MRKLNYQLFQLQKRYAEGSHATQTARKKILAQSANQLHEMGYRNLQARGLKAKHIDALAKQWREKGLSVGTIKNRMTHMRWWAEKIGKRNIVRKDNTSYGIDHRQYITNKDQSQTLGQRVDQIKDAHVQYALRLQEAFGLRREEAIKFNPSYADRGNEIALKASWTKGGKARIVPVRTSEQRALLNEIRAFVGFGSLIPEDKRYVDQLRKYEVNVQNAGLSKMHGLRHHYAQQRYKEITGWLAPTAGGPLSRYLSTQFRKIDRETRQEISRELGHERLEVVAIYLGS